MRNSISKRLFLRFVETPNESEPAGGGKPAEPAAKTGEQETTPDEPLGDGGKKALQAERDARKAADQKVKDLEKQIEDSNKSAEQRVVDDLKTAQAELATAKTQALKYEVAAEAGLDLKLAARLTGTTREELVADATALKELVGATPNTPQPDPNQGGGSNAPAKGVNAGRDLFADQHPSKKKS